MGNNAVKYPIDSGNIPNIRPAKINPPRAGGIHSLDLIVDAPYYGNSFFINSLNFVLAAPNLALENG